MPVSSMALFSLISTTSGFCLPEVCPKVLRVKSGFGIQLGHLTDDSLSEKEQFLRFLQEG